jgi:hypothetical protein
MLAALAKPAGLAPNPTGDASEAEALRAMTLLRRAVAMGCRSLNAFNHEAALDALRARPDFRLLLLDVAFPNEPFAQGR